MRGIFLIVIKHWYNVSMDIDYNEKDWAAPCPKYDCRKTACKCGLKYVNIPTSLGDDSEGSNVAPKNGAYCNALVIYEANNHVYIYSKEGVPTLIDVDASDISTLEQEVRKAQKDIVEFREDIDRFAYFFDTVADMKASDLLQSGDYAKTLGYHNKNDGGGALYKITSTGTANEMDVIAVGVLYAVLQSDQANVLQFGAYGDNTHADDAYIQRAYDKAYNDGIILNFPKKTYKIEGSLSLKHIVIRCDGTLNNTNTIKLGGLSGGGTSTDVYIYRAKNIQIEGAKVSYFKFHTVDDLTIYADGNDNTNTSSAYNVIEGVRCASLTINGVNGGWINENVIRFKRCLNSIAITGDGSYYHNNNRIENICLEGSSKTITINYGHNNFVSYRGESSPVVTIDSRARNYGNVVVKQYSSVWYRMYDDTSVNNTLNFIGNENLPTSRISKILSINVDNVKQTNTSLVIDSNGLIQGNSRTEYSSSNIDPTKPFTLIVRASNNSQRVYITCYDENDEGMEANVGSSIIHWDSTAKRYVLYSDVQYAAISYYPTDGVTRVKISITSGVNNHPYRYVEAFIATPYLNFGDFHNEIDMGRRYASSAPSSNTGYWEVGDIVYNSTPTAGGDIGWVCVVAGNPGTWKSFGTIAS